MAINLASAVPLPTVPVTNAAGQTDLAWQLWFMSISARTGGTTGVAGVPGGVPGNVQYNNGGAFGGYTNVQLTAQINPFTAALSGAVPASGGGTTKFLRADATFDLIDVSADVTGRLAFGNFSTIAADSLFGNSGTAAATGQNIAIGTGLTLGAGTLSAAALAAVAIYAPLTNGDLPGTVLTGTPDNEIKGPTLVSDLIGQAIMVQIA